MSSPISEIDAQVNFGQLCDRVVTTGEAIIITRPNGKNVALVAESELSGSDLAILRTTPALFGLFSLVVLFNHQLRAQELFQLRATAWYQKSLPTFADALVHVRQYLWDAQLFDPSGGKPDMIKVPKALFDTWSDLLCYAA
jgi:hypothetical protein